MFGMNSHGAALWQLQHGPRVRLSAPVPPPASDLTSHCEGATRRGRGVLADATARGASGSHSGAADNQSGQQPAGSAGGRGGGSRGGANGGEPIVLTGETSKKVAKPAERSSYRRRRKTDEERRQERAERQADLDALRKKGRVRDIGASSAGEIRVALVDGYNTILATRDLSRLAGFSMEDARQALNGLAAAYGAANGIRVYVVYDAMGSRDAVDRRVSVGSHAVVVFSGRSEADTYIGQAAAHWKRQGAEEVMVISNDRYVQDLVRDEDYVIYSVDMAAWLDQARLAAAAKARGGGGAAAAARLAFFPCRPGLQAGDKGEEDMCVVLPGSDELEARLAEAASGSSDDDWDGMEEESESAAVHGVRGRLGNAAPPAAAVRAASAAAVAAAHEAGAGGQEAAIAAGARPQPPASLAGPDANGTAPAAGQSRSGAAGLLEADAAAAAPQPRPPAPSDPSPPGPGSGSGSTGLGGLFGRGSKARLSGLVRRATQGLDPGP